MTRYSNSQIDKRNIEWFKNDMSKRSLVGIELLKGSIRGLTPHKLNFEYPITAIAGKNGTGKSTILALAACAYHNDSNGFKLPTRKGYYYTFSDFFIQSPEEISPDGIVIRYFIAHDKWKPTGHFPDGKGVGMQKRIKNKGGKWSDYSKRLKRNVIFYGIDRIVPHSEKSVSKSYRVHFKSIEEHNIFNIVHPIVGRIVGKQYINFEMKEHTKYRLPMVEDCNCKYSGFNMGAGENALFDLFTTIYKAPLGTLILIDEIELGLHEEAQTRLIHELKNVCNERKIQIICTTHSGNILKSLPPEGRIYIEKFYDSVNITTHISVGYSTALLAGRNSKELTIFVEDEIAKKILEFSLKNDYRQRVDILVIGSSNAVMRQMAARYKDKKDDEFYAVLDGDKRNVNLSNISVFRKSIEDENKFSRSEEWIQNRLGYLPGTNWPEKWIIEMAVTDCNNEISQLLNIQGDLLKEVMVRALQEERHNEFYYIADRLNIDLNNIISTICSCVVKKNKKAFTELNNSIEGLLNSK